MDYKIYGLRVIGSDEFRYIGYTKRKLSYRLSSHFYDCKRGSTYRKCNWIRSNNYNIEIILIEDNLEYEMALEREVYWISQYTNLTNMTKGGESNPMNDPEVKKKHSDVMKLIDKSKLATGIGDKNWMRSEEGRKWISIQNKERWKSGVYKDVGKSSRKDLDYNILYELYITQKKTLKEVAIILNTTYSSVVGNLGKHKIYKWNKKNDRD